MLPNKAHFDYSYNFLVALFILKWGTFSQLAHLDFYSLPQVGHWNTRYTGLIVLKQGIFGFN